MKLNPNCPYPVHPLCAELPLIEGKALTGFIESIKDQGRIVNEIVIIRKGANIGHNRTYDGPDAILDGRHRIMHGLASGIEWGSIPSRDYSFDRDGTPESLVLRDIKGRRHVDNIQRALIAAKIAKDLAESIRAHEQSKVVEVVVEHGKDADGGISGADPKPTGKKAAAAKPERASHQARNQAAKDADVSVDSVKKAQAIESHEDLVKAVKEKSMTLEAANSEAGRRREADRAKKNADKLAGQRKDALLLLRNTFGAANSFVKRVTNGAIFGKPGEDLKGHKDLLTFCELTLPQQRQFMPVLFSGRSLKEAQELQLGTPDDTWSIRDLIDHSLILGLGQKSDAKKFDFGGQIIEVSLNSEQSKAAKTLITKV